MSKTQSDVAAAVRLTGVRYEEETIVGLCSVDLIIPELKVAIEVDGPTHFTRTIPKRPLGPTMMKQRHLERAGWVVFSVNSDDWNVPDLWQQRMDELRDLLFQKAQEQLDGKA